MKVHFGQIYVEPGIAFPFSHHFQLRLGKELSSLIQPSTVFLQEYGTDWELMFRISAKTDIDNNEIRGPSVYKSDKDVEYTVFLPYDVITRTEDIPQAALKFLLTGCCHVFRQLEIDVAGIEDSTQAMIGSICSDPKMFAK